MNRFCASLATILMLSGFLASVGPINTTAQEPDKLIVPGKQLGPLKIGETPEDVTRLLGVPTRKVSGATAGAMNYEYEHVGVCSIDEVQFTAPPGIQVSAVATQNPACMTGKGIRVGSSGIQVGTAYGKVGPGIVENRLPNGYINLWYKNFGIAFLVSPRDTVVRLQVRRSGY